MFKEKKITFILLFLILCFFISCRHSYGYHLPAIDQEETRGPDFLNSAVAEQGKINVFIISLIALSLILNFLMFFSILNSQSIEKESLEKLSMVKFAVQDVVREVKLKEAARKKKMSSDEGEPFPDLTADEIQIIKSGF
ncbi:MAG: hypothetical protein M1536_09300 [Firmicutes bacterium]|nr:hypothetical protein [Bacillota bacterium]